MVGGAPIVRGSWFSLLLCVGCVMSYDCDLDPTLAAPSGICVDTVGQDGVDAWENNVMKSARELLADLERIETKLGARYCWEALCDGCSAARDWARILQRVEHWIKCCRRSFDRRGVFDLDPNYLVWGACSELQEIQDKIEAWREWGSQPV